MRDATPRLLVMGFGLLSPTPTNSPTTAPITDRVMATLAPAAEDRG
jgi:hypothetical protein